MTTFYDLSAKDIDGNERTFDEFKGKTVVVVNVASKCGFTPQYTGLEALYKKYADKGLVVLGFPCNQFGKQEPGDAEEIKTFCSTTYEVSFPMFRKIDVNGAETHPVYKYLKEKAPGLLGTEGIKWNFTKFVVDSKGDVVKRFGPKDTPESMEELLASLL